MTGWERRGFVLGLLINCGTGQWADGNEEEPATF